MNKDPLQVLIDLNEKFSGNFAEWQKNPDHKLDKSFSGLHCIAAVGDILNKKKTSKHHETCCKIYDEIFSDGVSSIYLAANAMDKPARIVLRRVLELGLAAIYLWDMPHMAFSWEKYDKNLSFTEMLSHVNSDGYIAYVENENNVSLDAEIVPIRQTQGIYGSLSDIVHGKITTFETSVPERFKYVEDDWNEFVTMLDEVVDILVSAYLKRFNIAKEVFGKIPQAKKEFS